MATQLSKIARDVSVMRERLVEKVPKNFSFKHALVAFFGALLFGFTFVLKGQLFNVGLSLTNTHLFYIVLSTLIILSLEILFVGYRRVPNKQQRPFFQFWLKRIVTYYAIALFTSWLLLWLYQITIIAGTPYNTLKLVIAISFPAAIGAAVADLLGKY